MDTTEPTGRVALNLRVPADLKRRIVDYATRRGLPITAAVIVLVEDALRQDQRP